MNVLENWDECALESWNNVGMKIGMSGVRP